jgi:hypothetical protein
MNFSALTPPPVSSTKLGQSSGAFGSQTVHFLSYGHILPAGGLHRKYLCTWTFEKYMRQLTALDNTAVCTYLLTYLLTELSPSWKAANCATPQELPSILWNPKVHHRVHNSPPLVLILSQIDRVHTIPSYLSKIYFNIVHSPTSWSS